MKERIEQIMQREGMKPGPFADSIGIQRSALSHILTGRNRPSLDVMMKILNRFTYISTDWLLKGEGPMFKHQVALEGSDASEGQQAVVQPIEFPDILSTDDASASPAPAPAQAAAPKGVREVVVAQAQPRTVSRIMIFYSDNTFENFVPEGQGKGR
jgi:transcriptional regulator with XRE-family HTH domain